MMSYYPHCQKIMTALNRAAKGRTTVVIAHRLSTVVDADNILVLDQGRIVEAGTHLSLVSNPKSLYHKLWQKQHEADRQLRHQKEKQGSEGEEPSSA